MKQSITFIDNLGTKRNIESNVGDTLMEADTSNDLPGIDAECGGACACATCHVYIDKEWADKIESKGESEIEMLDLVDELRDSSRLACQIKITDEMSGLIVTTPESQS